MSKLKNILSPIRTARLCDQARQLAEDAEERASILQQQLDAAIEENIKAQEIETENGRLRMQVSNLQEKLNTTVKALNESLSQSARFDELFKRINELEVLKTNYERVIGRLNERLEYCKTALLKQSQDTDDELTAIDLNELLRRNMQNMSEREKQAAAGKEDSSHSDRADDSDWYTHLDI